MAGESKRTYDARRRRERAEQERQATRRRVLEAARILFLNRGYVATTVAEIARQAGVALQSVYKVGRSKADLLHQVRDRHQFVDLARDTLSILLCCREAFLSR